MRTILYVQVWIRGELAAWGDVRVPELPAIALQLLPLQFEGCIFNWPVKVKIQHSPAPEAK